VLAREIRRPIGCEDGRVDGLAELSSGVDRGAIRSPARHEAGGLPLDLLPPARGLALPQLPGAEERCSRPALPKHVLQRLLPRLGHGFNVACTASYAVYDERMDGVSSPVEARLQALLDALPDLLLRLRADGTYLEVAGDVSRLANPPSVVIGSTVGDLLPTEIAEQLMSCVRAALRSGRLATVEYRLRTHLGEERDFEVRIAPASEDEVVAIVRDVTDLHDATRELKESRARLVAAGDAERRRVERNLHDGAQQRLVTVALHLQLIRRRLETDASEVPALVEAAQTELTLALEEIRELVRGLHPRLLGDRGLGPALAALAERAVLPVEIVDMPSGRLPAAVEAAAYYITAEALANAAKHSRASLVTVSICGSETGTVVQVVDNGVGGADPETGTGLRGLADRVAALGGALAVSSVPQQGTALRAELPHS
jgi:PAS domain S-box-containing protein